MAKRRPGWTRVLYTALWVLALAVLPWWLGLPILLGLAATIALLQQRLEARHLTLTRRALRWGLPGWLIALQHALGGNALAWGAALLGALAGYTLLAGLEAWLDRDPRRAPPAVAAPADWSARALAPVGPPAAIIELQLPAWQDARGELPDPHGGEVQCDADGCRFATGERIDPPGAAGFAQVGFSPEGRWFTACTPDQRLLVLWDRRRGRRHRLRGWQLRGWYREQPWLSRHEDGMPLALHAVLGRDEEA